jgi:hypothetical protein
MSISALVLHGNAIFQNYSVKRLKDRSRKKYIELHRGGLSAKKCNNQAAFMQWA